MIFEDFLDHLSMEPKEDLSISISQALEHFFQMLSVERISGFGDDVTRICQMSLITQDSARIPYSYMFSWISFTSAVTRATLVSDVDELIEKVIKLVASTEADIQYAIGKYQLQLDNDKSDKTDAIIIAAIKTFKKDVENINKLKKIENCKTRSEGVLLLVNLKYWKKTNDRLNLFDSALQQKILHGGSV